jgi:hypothetical protein
MLVLILSISSEQIFGLCAHTTLAQACTQALLSIYRIYMNKRLLCTTMLNKQPKEKERTSQKEAHTTKNFSG